MRKTLLQQGNESMSAEQYKKYDEMMWFLIENLSAHKEGKLSADKVEYLNKNIPNWIEETQEVIDAIIAA
ncbi:MAG: hypothetical protein PHF17_08335 [Arcobacteraceae bacterium]|nr:hypothetical protein [Arcobacteraceae bacterium]